MGESNKLWRRGRYGILLTDDAVVLMPRAPAMVGKDAVKAAYTDYYATYDLQYDATSEEVEVFGDRAYMWARVEGTRRSKKDNREEELAFDNVWLLEQQPDGWKFRRVIFNASLVTE